MEQEQIHVTEITNASASALRGMVLDGSVALDQCSNKDLVKYFFGITSEEPSPVEITTGILKSVHSDNGVLAEILRNKFKLGDLWKFTTDFGPTVTLQKVPNENKFNSLKLVMETSIDETHKEIRPLVEFTGGKCEYFSPEDRTIISAEPVKPVEEKRTGFQFTTTPDEAQASVESKQEEINNESTVVSTGTPSDQAQNETGSELTEDRPDTVTDVAVGESHDDAGEARDLGTTETVSEPEQTSELTPVSELDKPNFADLSVDIRGVTKLQLERKIFMATKKILESGQCKSVEMVATIIGGVLTDYNVTAELNDAEDTIIVSIQAKPALVTPPEVPKGIPEQEEAVPETAEPAIESVQEEEELASEHARDVAGQIAAAEVGAEILHEEGRHEEAAAIEERTAEIKAAEGIQDEDASKYTIKEGTVIDLEIVDDELIVKYVFDGTEITRVTDPDILSIDTSSAYVALCDITPEILKTNSIINVVDTMMQKAPTESTTTPEFNEELAKVDAEAIENGEVTQKEVDNLNEEMEAAETPAAEQPQEEIKEMTVRINCKEIVPQDDVAKIRSIIEANVSASGNTELTGIVSNALGYECIVEVISQGSEYVVSIPMEDEGTAESEKDSQPESVVDPEALQQQMSSDKGTEPVSTQWIDLGNPDIADAVLKVLFPDISRPSYMHLTTYLRNHHTEAGTPSFIATKGTFPTETTIVYDNVTFAIVKMKDGRFWRIFAANTDPTLRDHAWIATNNVPGRWFQLGSDIHNNVDYQRGGYRQGGYNR